jgi:hypothetical protein
MLSHRVRRVLTFFSSCLNWDYPNPSPARECAPPPLVPGGGAHSRAREGGGWESLNYDEGTYTVVLFTYMYFVSCSYHFLFTVGESAYDEQSVKKVQGDPVRRHNVLTSWRK